MARIFITGSADGLGLMTGRPLAEQGHARAIAFAVEQPGDVDVNELIVPPTASPH